MIMSCLRITEGFLSHNKEINSPNNYWNNNIFSIFNIIISKTNWQQ